MASMNLGPFGEHWFHWFERPPQPISFPNLFSLALSQNPPKPLFSSLSLSDPKQPKPDPSKPGKYQKMMDQYWWECENLPDYRHAPEVDKILKEDPVFEHKENPKPEEIEENNKWWEEFRSSPVVQFLTRAEEIADNLNKAELQDNKEPYRNEDAKLWKALPHVTGLDGRPMPRKSIKTTEEAENRFWDFTKQFFFGLWGFRQRPYPPGRPIDFSQVIGYKRLEKRYYDFAMRTGGWYYKDRLGRTRGPCELIQLKTAWSAGIIDTHTFIWGEDMDEWAPIGMIYGVERAIATWEVRLGAAATAFLHKLQKGISPWTPLKGHEKKTYEQLQQEAVESKKRDLAVLKANDGVWPGVRTPSHALFLWASGSELTTMLEADHMPNKYIPKDLRKQLAKAIPGLRPWEVLSVEQAMDQITYNGQWYREPLGSYTTGPPYIKHWNRDALKMLSVFSVLSQAVIKDMRRKIPGFDQVMNMFREDALAREQRIRQQREQNKRDEEDALYGRSTRDP
ncbi:protein TIC 56, chloroplastic [Amaranthus tricolor]|uniref:protein TIC 56, chloroplastic n=1 Tax=Amaranthus tricolor TaxID=29722 RepID=UPI00258471CD|nr:protein TIC 56, chloroplastic [Amaranthus tricolor]XP_057524324.1 protein TIC 56, chloroplastic [Amaranthus tricolor]